MFRIIGALFALIFLAITALFIAALIIPKDVYKARIEQQGTEMLGRELVIVGDISLALFPKISVTANKVQIANPPEFSSKAFITTEQMRVGIRLLPLFSKQIEITEFVLMQPDISLEKTASGTVNWVISKNKTANDGNPKGFSRNSTAMPLQASLGDVRFVNGSAIYFDHGTNSKTTVSKINLQLKMPSMKQEISLTGDMHIKEQTISINMHLASLADFLNGRETPFSLKLASDMMQTNFDGVFLSSSDIKFSGKLDLNISSLKQLAKIAGTDFNPAPETFETASFSGEVDGQLNRISFKQATFNFDQVTGKGDFSITLTNEKPTLSGTLSIANLNLNPYLPPVPAPGTPIAPWSKQELVLDMLQLANIDMRLNIARMKMRNIEFTETKIKAILENGRLQSTFEKSNLYGGNGSGKIVLNSRNHKNALTIKGEIVGVQALPLFAAATGFDRIEGVGQVQFDVAAAGKSIDAMMQSLRGTSAMQLRDGTIRGVNLAQVLRNAQSFLLSGSMAANDNTPAKTDFSELSGSFKITGGVAKNTDMLMVGPLVRVTGQGQIDLGRQTLDYQLKPRAVASLKGQGGDASLQGLNVPFRLQGPWNQIKAGIDTSVLQKQALQRAKNEAAKLVRDNVGGSLGGVLQGFLGAPDKKEQTTPQPKKQLSDEEKALGILGDLFGLGQNKEKQGEKPQSTGHD